MESSCGLGIPGSNGLQKVHIGNLRSFAVAALEQAQWLFA
jgi:hypothetical protein